MTAASNTGVIVQARMSSRRLPGKVLRPIAGRPMLEYLLERLGRCERVSHVVISTSVDHSDDPVEQYCQARGIACHRGDLDNVAGRFLQTLERYDFEAFVRLCADSPLLDPRLVDHAAGIFDSGRYDLVTNLFKRTFPKGQSVEVLDTEAFRKGYARMGTPEQFEHVTRYFYENPAGFRIFNFVAPDDFSGLRLTVDTQEDLSRIAEVISRMDRPHWQYGWSEIVADLCAATT